MEKGKRIQFKDWDCELVKQSYSNGRIALSLIAWETDEEADIYEGDSIAMATINIPEADIADDEVIIKDYSENEGMMSALFNAGVIVPTGREVASGFITASVCKLTI